MHDVVSHIANSFLKNVAQVATGTVVRRGEEVHTVLIRFQVITLAETGACAVIRVIHRNA